MKFNPETGELSPRQEKSTRSVSSSNVQSPTKRSFTIFWKCSIGMVVSLYFLSSTPDDLFIILGSIFMLASFYYFFKTIWLWLFG